MIVGTPAIVGYDAGNWSDLTQDTGIGSQSRDKILFAKDAGKIWKNRIKSATCLPSSYVQDFLKCLAGLGEGVAVIHRA